MYKLTFKSSTDNSCTYVYNKEEDILGTILHQKVIFRPSDSDITMDEMQEIIEYMVVIKWSNK